mmetsp:Transcript_36085/g.52903  ORF Transcript_36085/g.52903 Transcript_36085/m.52903 type:complete len:337 (+) Transcript_36085:34-1044(+)|eukprot:CAMPEP_0195507276 /NCGR_PEP_ID=MMETSP0794_2-20130614/755_1 /TAXON_ID=515487 /ORGANISM="Stephanopyxis turris, Strain CCMP 815" /LENGTH=336 /DNA_ID=CAMNT_0040633909 /DNA_START=34 /DNA_END=1044 /DNA_ORIENTATION=-
MADTATSSASAASFFAKKKKGKKSFKSFNANKIDASAVDTSVHVDAPIIQQQGNATVAESKVGSTGPPTTNTTENSTDEWDDGIPGTKNPAVITSNTGAAASELLDMKALEEKRREQDDVAERMRIEENKSKLQAAKDGMERQAKQMEAEKIAKQEKQQFSQQTSAKPSDGGKWIPSYKRSGPTGGLAARMSAMGMTSSSVGSGAIPRKVDTQDNSAFPDLASAAEISKEKEAFKPAYVLPKKKKPTGVPAWGASKTGGKPVKAKQTQKSVEKKETAPAPSAPVEVEKAPATSAPVTTTVSTPAPKADSTSTAAPTPAPVVRKKKKKKDLSTFKSS